MKKAGLKAIIGGGLGLLIGGTISISSHKRELPSLEVLAGTIGYNQGPIISHGFNACSAIIFDYGNRAIMAHAVPGSSFKVGYDHVTGAEDAIGEILEISASKGLNPQSATIYIDAGGEDSFKEIMSDLNANGLTAYRTNKSELHKKKLDKRGKRGVLTSVYFNPAQNYIHTRPTISEDTKQWKLIASDHYP